MGVTINTLPTFDITGANKIGEGRYRNVYRVGNVAIKTLKPSIRKDYYFFNLTYEQHWYTKHKFGIGDFNQFEYDMFTQFIEKVPPDFRNRFAHIHSVFQIEGTSHSISDLVLDSTGNVSRTLHKYGQVHSDVFWNHIDALQGVFIDEQIPLMDIRGENIMVQETSAGVFPVFIDFKRYGARTYPVHFWLSSEKQRIAKMQRKFERLRELYRPS